MNYIAAFALVCFVFLGMEVPQSQLYDPNLVEISKTKFHNDDFYFVDMSRSGDRVKAKYFAAEDYNGNSVYERYKQWAKGKNVICVTSGTYMDDCRPQIYKRNNPVGLTIDNGVVVNYTYENKFDGLVIVYATGGVVVSNIKDKNLQITCGNSGLRTFDVSSYYQRQQFIECAKQVGATVFQTHLLIFKDKLRVYSNSSLDQRERRFLAVYKDYGGGIRHAVVHSPSSSTLLEGSRKVHRFLKEFRMANEVVFMINLDTGCQDIFELYNSNGSMNTTIKGRYSVSEAANLLVYYYD